MRINSLITLLLFAQISAFTQKPNIIFITVDDLNDYIGVLGGHPHVETPYIDSLARTGVTFTNAFANAPLCAPSRTSFMSGKDVQYTQVYSNEQVANYFRDNFTAGKNNEDVISIPEHLKNNGYYTFGINKVFHNSAFLDYDSINTDPCTKDLSWSRVTNFEDIDWVHDEMILSADGIDGYEWGVIDDSLESLMEDHRAVDTAIQFINDVADGSLDLCDEQAFFLALGIARPHLDLFIPEHYFPDYYLSDFFEEPFDIPYNQPNNANPPNGIAMPPQPEIVWNDYYQLGLVGQEVATGTKDLEHEFRKWRIQLPVLPEISDTLYPPERTFIVEQSKRADAVMAYIAAVEYADMQVGRLINALEAHPDIYNNTIIILVSDHGFSMGEKRHWLKRSLWETDIRIPFIIVRPGHPGNLFCNRAVSLLDLFPTICDLASVEEPSFDGEPYLDGQSILPLLNNVNKKWENPVLVSWEAEPDQECSCHPQYAVRSDRFHYIKYQSDNDVINSDVCNEATSIREEELYEVGVNRETDPNEWNNLIADETYAPVLHYLQQFLPDSSLYLQKAYTVEITYKTIPCFLTAESKLKLQTKLYNTEGTLIAGPALNDYQFRWTNSLTAAVQYGKGISFNMATVPVALYSTADRILFYLEVTQISTGKFVGFTTKTFYVNPANMPAAIFDLQVDDVMNSATVINYGLNGSVVNTYWNFGDGFITEDQIPATHFYPGNGIYTVTNYIQYGNGCTLPVSEIADVSLKIGVPSNDVFVYPNPASNLLHIATVNPLSDVKISILDLAGRKVYEEEVGIIADLYSIDINHLSNGFYIIKIDNDQLHTNRQFEIMK